MALATRMPVVFGDERDQVLKQFNLIQALWGTGRGIYNHNSPFVEFGSQYNRFKVCPSRCYMQSARFSGHVQPH